MENVVDSATIEQQLDLDDVTKKFTYHLKSVDLKQHLAYFVQSFFSSQNRGSK
jgi:TATA-box binding protein (TBP) (component of TFIID and TFIIIB)